MPINKANVRDARPQINAEGESEKKLFSAEVSKGSINLKRGDGRQPSFALKYQEVKELTDFLGELSELLEKNQYQPAGSLEDGYVAGSARHTPTPRASTTAAAAAQVPSESGVVSAATQGTGTDTTTAGENTIVPELASGAEAQAAFDAEPSQAAVPEITQADLDEEPAQPVQVSQPVQPATDVDNPFSE